MPGRRPETGEKAGQDSSRMASQEDVLRANRVAGEPVSDVLGGHKGRASRAGFEPRDLARMTAYGATF